MTKLIFLVGHRKQMGKDTTCNIIEKLLIQKNISFIRTSFARKLKKSCAEKYNLDFKFMEFEQYKNSKPEHLGGRSVRDVLIMEGNSSRKIWNNVWVSSAYKDILDSPAEVALISDFRYPNEYDAFTGVYNTWVNSNIKDPEATEPKVIKVLIHRPAGTFNSDGSDDQLPDLVPNYWDEIILNNVEDSGWYKNIESQVRAILQKNLEKYVLNSFTGKS